VYSSYCQFSKGN